MSRFTRPANPLADFFGFPCTLSADACITYFAAPEPAASRKISTCGLGSEPFGCTVGSGEALIRSYLTCNLE